jgi:Amt family ammonium transporter
MPKHSIPKSLPIILISAIALLGLASSIFSGATPTTPDVTAQPINSGDTAWMLTATALVLLMTPGLAFFYGGMVSRKNVIATMLQSFTAMGIVSILWIIVGFSLAFGDSYHGIIGSPFTFFMFNGVGGSTNAALSPTIPLALFALFQLKFAIITPALITGSFAERIRYSSYLLFICLWSIFIYSPLAHMTWHPQGLLRTWGILDFAGGTVVHMSAGLAALAAALVLGRRRAHITKTHLPPANIPFVLLGTGLLWFGWFGFNAGSALAASESAALAFLTTNTASAAAMMTWLACDYMRGHKPSAMGSCIGAVVGLVAITPAAGYVTVGSSLVIGIIAAACCNIACIIKSRTSIDDSLDVFPCHGVGGIIGMIATGVFAQQVGLISGETTTFVRHCIALFLVGGATFIGSYLLLQITDKIIPLRVTDDQEDLGLDMSNHGEQLDPPATQQQQVVNKNNQTTLTRAA